MIKDSMKVGDFTDPFIWLGIYIVDDYVLFIFVFSDLMY